MVLTIKDNNSESGIVYSGLFGKLANQKDENSWYNQSQSRLSKYYDSLVDGKKTKESKKILADLKNIDETTYDIIKKSEDHDDALKKVNQSMTTMSGNFDTAKLKAIAFNAAVNIGVALLSTLVTIGVQKLLENFKSAEEVAKSATSALERYKEAQETIKSNAEEANDLLDDYNTLSKGVNSLGENVSLSSDEFERYHEIVNKVAQMFPTLVQGWDSEGNAIINNIKNLKEYIALQQRKEAQALVNGTGDYEDEGSVEDIIKNANNKIKSKSHISTLGTMEYGTQTTVVFDEFGLEDKTNALVKLLNSLTDKTGKSFKKFIAGFSDFNSELYGQEAAYKQLLEDIGLDVTQGWADMSFDEYDFNYLKNNISTIQNSIGTFKTDLEQYKSDYVTAANSILIANTDYGNWLSAQEDTAEYASKQIIDTFIQNTDVSWFAGKTQDELKAALQDIVNIVENMAPDQKDQYEIMLAVNTKFNDGDISYDAWKTKIDAFLELFGDGEEGKEKVKTFKIAFDYEDVTNKYNQARNALRDDNNPTGVGDIFSIDGKTNGSVKVDDVLGFLNNNELEQVCNKEFQEKLTKWFKKTSPKTAEEIANWIRDSVAKAKKEDFNSKDLFEKLSQSAEALKILDTAFSELKEDGDVSYDTLSKIRTTFSNVDGIDNYINKLAEAKGNTTETNSVLNDLATAYVKLNLVGTNLANANQAVVASMLKEAGVANSNKVAMQMIAKAKIEAAIESGDLTNKTLNEIIALNNEGNTSNYTAQQLKLYAFEKQLANETSLDTSDSVNNLLILAKTAGITGQKIADLTLLLQLKTDIENGKVNNKGLAEKRIKELQESIKNNNYTDNIESKFTPVNFTGNTQNKSNNSSNSSSSYTATEDPWLKKRQAELDKVAHQHEMGKISEAKYLDKIQKIEKKFAPQIKKKQAEVDKLQKKYNNMSKSQRKSKSGQKLKKDLDQAKQDLKDIKKQDQDLQKEIHGLELDNRKDKYDKFRDKQIEKYKNGKITLKKLNEVLSKKRKELFGSFDKDTYNDYIESDKEKVNKAAVERRKTIYDEYKEAKIKEYEDGKITIKQLEKLLKDKIKSLFGDLDTETYNELLGDVPDDIKQALKDKFDLDMDKLDNRRDFDLIKDEDYYKEKLALAEEYYKQSEEFADDYTKALVEMYDYAKDQYINDLEKQKEALEEQKDAISDFYENQKKLLQDQSDNDTYLKDQTEKRKTVNDLKMQIAELERDTSEKSRKKIAELQDQLVNAEDELSDFEKQYALDQTIAMLEEMEEKHLESIDNQIKLIDNKITSINDNTGNTYKAIVDFVKKKYGVTIDVSKVGLATNNLGSLANNLAQPFLNMISSLWKQSSFATYASGTSSSVGGLVKTQESRLAELIGMNTGSGTFTMLTPSSKVWNSEATDFLYKFANNPTKSLLEKLGETTSSIAQNITTVNNSPTYNVNINKGAVVVQGNADEKVLEKSTKDLTYNILYELKKLK